MTKLLDVFDKGSGYVRLEVNLPDGLVELVTFNKLYASVGTDHLSNEATWEAVKRWGKNLPENRSTFAGSNVWTIVIAETEVFRCERDVGVFVYGEQIGNADEANGFFPLT